MSAVRALLLALSMVALSAGIALADGARSTLQPAALAQLGFQQHPGAALPLDAALRDEAGTAVRLGNYFGHAPVILVLEYLHCPNLCGLVMGNLLDALGHVPLQAGRDYQVVAVSIDPREGPADARADKASYVARDRRAATWHFLTGDTATVKRIADAVGFPYRYDATNNQFAHPAGVVLASADGKIARYILGLGYRPLDLRLGIADAAAGTVAAPAARLLLLCYCYDPETGRYSIAVNNLLRAGGFLTVLAVAVPIATRLRRPGKKR
jgi:protein SCO1/2